MVATDVQLPDINLPEQVDLDTSVDTTQPDKDAVWIPDLWLPNEEQLSALQTQKLLLGLDTIDVSVLRGLRFDWLAGYVGGHWPTFHPMCLAYPALARAGRVMSYAVNYLEDADWLDCELGDATVAEANPWIARQFARGHKKPGVYANWSRWANEGLLNDLSHWGNRITRIVAHYTFVPQISHSGFDCQQYTDRYAGRNVDGNVALASLFQPGPAVVNSLHYELFTTGEPVVTRQWGKVDERNVVLHYDGARKHMDEYKDYINHYLRPELKFLADRVANAAIHTDPLPNHKANWGKLNRGWRYQQLIHRSQGMQFAK